MVHPGGADLLKGTDCLVEGRREAFPRRGNISGHGASKHLKHHYPRRVNVRPRVGRVPSPLLGGCVAWRSAGALAGCGQAVLGVNRPGQTEIKKFHGARFINQYVARLDVPVDDPGPVGVVERLEGLPENLQGLPERQRTRRIDDVRQRLPPNVIHHIEALALLLAAVENTSDVGVLQFCGGPRFPLEQTGELGIVHQRLADDFHRNELAQFRVFRQIDFPHAPFSQHLDQPVLPENEVIEFRRHFPLSRLVGGLRFGAFTARHSCRRRGIPCLHIVRDCIVLALLMRLHGLLLHLVLVASSSFSRL